MNITRQTGKRLAILLMIVTWLAMFVADARALQDSECSISLRLEQQQAGGITNLWLTGFVNSFIGQTAGQTVRLSITGPNGQIVLVKDITIGADGSYRYQLNLQQQSEWGQFFLNSCLCVSGVYRACVSYHSACSETFIPVLPPAGSAIIVAGYGGQTWNHITGRTEDLQGTINSMAEYAYVVLRHFLDLPMDRIYLLHPNLLLDRDLDGRPDTDCLPISNNLKLAIESWASQQCSDCPRQGPLIIYIVSGLADSDSFYINSREVITSGELALWLGQLKTAAAGLKANVILEFPASGSFINDLTALVPDLVIMCSSGDSLSGCGQAHLAEAGGKASFGWQLFTHLMLGDCTAQAWVKAEQFILMRYNDQCPQLYGGLGGQSSVPCGGQFVPCGNRIDWPCGESWFSICGRLGLSLGSIACRTTLRCTVGEPIDLRACICHPIFERDCRIHVVAFPPEGVIRPNIVFEPQYLEQMKMYCYGLPDGFDVPGLWRLLYTAEDPDGNIAVASEEVLVALSDIDDSISDIRDKIQTQSDALSSSVQDILSGINTKSQNLLDEVFEKVEQSGIGSTSLEDWMNDVLTDMPVNSSGLTLPDLDTTLGIDTSAINWPWR